MLHSYHYYCVSTYLGVTDYMIAACVENFNRAIPLLVIWSLIVGYKIYAVIRDSYGKEIAKLFYPGYIFDKNMLWIKW